MSGSPARLVLVASIVAATLAGCGKKGNPLPPLRPVPAGIETFSARRAGDRIILTVAVPSTNADGTTPAAVDRIEIYAMTTAEGMPPPAAAELVGVPERLQAAIGVRRPDEPAGDSSNPAPGETAFWIDTTVAPAEADAVHYAAVAVAGTGRGRRGSPAGPLTVPLGELPSPPSDIAVSHDETTIHVRWPAVPGVPAFRVLEAPAGGGEASALTPVAVTGTEFTLPVEFGRERCFAVQSVVTEGEVSVESNLSPLRCVVPVDRYGPPAPRGLRAVQEGAAMTLIWTAAESADLAGYIVLRGEGAGDRLQPLVRDPLPETTYRDTAVEPGVTYTYAVVAFDRLGNPSEQSERQTVTVR